MDINELVSEQTKECTSCGEEKVLSEFHKHKFGTYGRQSRCKVCQNAANRERYRQNTPVDKG